EEPGAEPAAYERADDAEDDSDDATRRVPPWHQKFRQRPGDEAEEDPIKPERQTLLPAFLRRCESGNARRSCTTSRRHPVDPKKDQCADNRENDALDRESVQSNAGGYAS